MTTLNKKTSYVFQTWLSFHPLHYLRRRRERNKALARKTREKKKEELETLREMMQLLETENCELRMQLSAKKAKVFERLLLQANALTMLGPIKYDNSNDTLKLSPMAQQCFKTIASDDINESQSFCITNPRQKGNPILYASSAFANLTGYSIDEVLGRNCNFLQGQETNQNDVLKISKAVREGSDLKIALINYKKDGSTFWNRLELFALKDSCGSSAIIVGLQTEISREEAILLTDASTLTKISSTSIIE